MTSASGPAFARSTAESLLIGISRPMVEVRYLLRQVAASSASVIVTGPSGSGKEMVARAIHAESERAARSYVAVNCGAIPRDLLESELFGHEKGAFTGAVTQKRGKFEDADGGTLFLDEIGDMPSEMQVKLLRVLEEKSVQRVGGRGEIAVDARIVSATHRDLHEAIDAQRFREDLYYRLAVFPIDLPSLGERREDIPLLVNHFLKGMGPRGELKLSQKAVDRLMAHNWPGNVRELRNVIERAVILFPGQVVSEEQVEIILCRRGARSSQAERSALWEATEKAAPVPAAIAAPEPAPEAEETTTVVEASARFAREQQEPSLAQQPVDLRQMIGDLEHRYIAEALRISEGVVADAARLLSLQRTTLIEKMRKYGLARVAA
ncbi:MAG TPA: sigma-54 dependent transcriptional regulator [Allosphingosinicella sp.]|nr:sigma-54 dependent transcriptional regulator [Allosphingosinicella sp.]